MLIIEHIPFIFLVTIVIYTVLYIFFIYQVHETPNQKSQNWLTRHPHHAAVIAGGIFIVVSLLVISLSTDIL